MRVSVHRKPLLEALELAREAVSKVKNLKMTIDKSQVAAYNLIVP